MVQQNETIKFNSVMYDATQFKFGPLDGSAVCTGNKITRNVFLFLVSNCFDIPESKGISGIYHKFTTTRPCMGCLGTSTDYKTCVRYARRHVETIRRRRIFVPEIFKSTLTTSSKVIKIFR